MTVREYYHACVKRAEQAGLEDPAFDISQLFAKSTGISRWRMPLEGDRELTQEEQQHLETMVKRRLEGYPLQYLLGEWEFYGLPFYVGEGVLIPRPDTETLVDTALGFLTGTPSPKILDLCSGTGCIAISIAKNKPDANITAVELSSGAYQYLCKNIRRNHAAQVTPVQGDIFAVRDSLPACHLIVSNPPYLTGEEMSALQKEVSCEPGMALLGADPATGEGVGDGLYFYRRIAREYRGKLIPGGAAAFEVGDRQAGAVASILEENRYYQITVAKDLAGIQRVVMGIKG